MTVTPMRVYPRGLVVYCLTLYTMDYNTSSKGFVQMIEGIAGILSPRLLEVRLLRGIANSAGILNRKIEVLYK